MEKVEDPLFIKMTLRLIKMESLFVLPDAACVVMVLKLQKAGWNSNVLKSVIKMAVSPVPAKLPVLMPDTDALFIWLWKIIQRLFNNPPRSSKEWKLEYNARTPAKRSNKREKLDFKLEDGRHRSTKMWYCRLYHILMLQHLDAWDLPPESTLKKMILDVA